METSTSNSEKTSIVFFYSQNVANAVRKSESTQIILVSIIGLKGNFTVVAEGCTKKAENIDRHFLRLNEVDDSASDPTRLSAVVS